MLLSKELSIISCVRAFKVHSNDAAVNEEGSIQGSLFSDDVTWSLRGSLESISLAAVLLPSLHVVYKVDYVKWSYQDYQLPLRSSRFFLATKKYVVVWV